MAATGPSRRARIITNFRALLVGSGIVRGTSDAVPSDYLREKPPWAWVFEGYEVKAENRKLHNLTEHQLEVHVHQTFPYVRGDALRDLNPTGRDLLADMQELIIKNYRLGDEAWLTQEGGNAIGTPVGTEKPIGILATLWVVHYDTPPDDPRA